MEPIKLPTLGYFKNGNGWLGSAGLMRYQIEKPDENGQVTVVLWQGPFSRPYAQETGRETFPLDDESGLAALREFLAAKAQEMAQNPPFTPEATTAFYQTKKAEETASKEE